MSVEFYEKNAESFIAQTGSIDMNPLYERFCSVLPTNARVLDAGCGSGRDALAFSQMGYDVVAFDASKKMVEAARERAQVPVFLMDFNETHFDHPFDGIWACASLLHVARHQLTSVLMRLSTHMIRNGVLYASFKYGAEEREKDGRYFNDLNEFLLETTIEPVSSLSISETWVTSDQRPHRPEEKWLNCLILRR
jgi:SAM-dependent methyltransferase